MSLDRLPPQEFSCNQEVGTDFMINTRNVTKYSDETIYKLNSNNTPPPSGMQLGGGIDGGNLFVHLVESEISNPRALNEKGEA